MFSYSLILSIPSLSLTHDLATITLFVVVVVVALFLLWLTALHVLSYFRVKSIFCILVNRYIVYTYTQSFKGEYSPIYHIQNLTTKWLMRLVNFRLL